MLINDFKYIKDSIIFKLLKIVFSVYFVFTFTLTCIHLYANYSNAVGRLQSELASYARSFKPTLFKSMHFNDDNTVQLTVESLMQNPEVVGVKFKKNGKFWQKGVVADTNEKNTFAGNGKISKKDLVYLHSKLISYTTDINYVDENGKNHTIGRATLYSSYRIIFDEIKFDFSVILANALLKTIVLWNLFIWSAATFLSKPLGKLSSKLEEFDLKTLQKINVIPFEQGAKNELQCLQSSFNTMIDNLSNEVYKREKFQKALIRSEQYLKNLFDAMPSALICVDKNNCIRDWNNSSTKLFSMPDTKVLNKQFLSVLPALKEQAFFIDAARKQKKIQKIDKTNVVLNNKNKVLSIDVFPVDNFAENIIIRLDDITEKTNFENVIVQTEKMSSLGTLVAGVAHEINNPLGTILQGIQNIKRRLDKNLKKNQDVAKDLNVDLEVIEKYIEAREIYSFLQGAQGAGERAANIVKSVLSFSRKSDNNKIKNNISNLIVETIDIVKTDYEVKKSNIISNIFYHSPESDDVDIYCIKSEIQQVLLNIIKNAIQAMIENNTKNPEINICCNTSAKYIEISVEDNGPGIPAEIKNKIFEPFYTTKDIGVGTGLGLSVSYNIVVEKHNGSIYVESTENQGSKFVIRLPRS